MNPVSCVFGPERGCRLSILQQGTGGIVVRVAVDLGAADRSLGSAVTPGAPVKVLQQYPRMVFRCGNTELAVDAATADLIFVKPDDDW